MTPFGQPAAFRLEIEVCRPEPLDPQSGGPVRLVSISGGRVLGSLHGRILPGGTDWQTIQPDGTIEIEARYLLELDDGTRVELQARGLRRADAQGFWSSNWLYTTSQAHDDLNRQQFLGWGEKSEEGVVIEVFALPDGVHA
jgi:Protein of unknown function (DUF3237)